MKEISVKLTLTHPTLRRGEGGEAAWGGAFIAFIVARRCGGEGGVWLA